MINQSQLNIINILGTKRRFKQNIALAMVSINNSEIGTVLDVKMNDKIIKATVAEKPFYDPKKKLASS